MTNNKQEETQKMKNDELFANKIDEELQKILEIDLDNLEDDDKVKNRQRYLLDLMIKCYDGEDQRIRDVDGKSSQMIAILGVMFSVQTTFLASLINPPFKSILILFFLIPLFFYLLAIFYLIQSVNFKTFEVLPEQNALVEYYEEEKSYSEIVSILLGNYQETINSNTKVIDDKADKSEKGLKFLLHGVIFTIIFIIVYFLI